MILFFFRKERLEKLVINYLVICEYVLCLCNENEVRPNNQALCRTHNRKQKNL
jgi:hypothetical protein